MYATKPGASWSLTPVDTATNTNPRHTAIAYVDQHDLGTADDTIDYAYCDGTNWQVEQIATTPHVLGGTDLALPGSNTTAQVVYSNGSGWYLPPVHATRSGSCTLNTGLGGTADYDYAAYIAMDLDSSGNPAIVYLDTWTGDVRYASYNGTSWSVQTALTSSASTAYQDYRYLDMAFDQWDNAHLVFYDTEAEQLNYTYLSGGVWAGHRTWDVDSYCLDLAIDSVGVPHFAYYDNSDGKAYRVKGEAVPEPTTLVLLGLGLVGLGAKLRRRRLTA